MDAMYGWWRASKKHALALLLFAVCAVFVATSNKKKQKQNFTIVTDTSINTNRVLYTVQACLRSFFVEVSKKKKKKESNL